MNSVSSVEARQNGDAIAWAQVSRAIGMLFGASGGLRARHPGMAERVREIAWELVDLKAEEMGQE